MRIMHFDPYSQSQIKRCCDDPPSILTLTQFPESTEALLWFRAYTFFSIFSLLPTYPSGVHPSRLLYLFLRGPGFNFQSF